MNRSQSVAAFFDLDGTLLPPPSLEWRFISYLVWRDKLETSNIFRWLLHAARSLPRGRRRAIEENKCYLAGLPESLVADWTNSLASDKSNPDLPRFFGEGLDRIRWHQSREHRIFLVSGTLQPLAAHVARQLPGDIQCVATELALSRVARSGPGEPEHSAESDSRQPSREYLYSAIWTGELAGEHMVGTAKRRALDVLALRHRLDLTRCYAYGDSITDCAMLETVGHPEVINPSPAMARLARERGWPVSRWVEPASDRDKTPSFVHSDAPPRSAVTGAYR